MASNTKYLVTKNPDGDVSFGNRNGVEVTLQPANSDYPLGGYAINSWNLVVDGTIQPTAVNCDLASIDFVIPVGGQGGYSPVWNRTSQKLEMFQDSSAQGPGGRVTTGTDLSAYAFQLLLFGY